MLRHRSEFPVEGELPALDGATVWFNSAPLRPAGLRGQVVLAGEAPHATGRADLERVVASVPGVLAVENEILIVGPIV